MLQEESHSILNVWRWDQFLAVDALVAADLQFLLLCVVNRWHVEGVVAVWADDLQRGNRTIVELLGRLRLEDWVGDGLDLVLFVLVRIVLVAELELFGVDAEALGDEVNFDAIDVLDESRDGRQQLLRDVPVGVDLQILLLVHVFFRTVCEIANRRFTPLVSAAIFTDNIGYEIVDEVGVTLSLLLHADGNLNVWQIFGIGVVFRLTRQLFRDDEVGEGNLTSFQLLSNV